MPDRRPDLRSVALLRGINVGRAKRIAMADLRALFESLGYRDVRTLLNSGNVVFAAPPGKADAAAARIEKAIASSLGVSCRVTVLGAEELDAVVAGNPLGAVAEDPARLLVAFLRVAADRSKLAPLLKESWGTEHFALGAGVAYLWCPGGVISSPLAERVARLLGDAVTMRNWSTVGKLLALARAE